MSERINWSYSTLGTLRQCSRKFYFSNILANYGKTDKLKRKAFELKQMQNILMWQGSVVDKIMELRIIPLIKEGKPVDFVEIAYKAVALAEERFHFSKDKMYSEEGMTKTDAGEHFCILNIHELEEELPPNELSTAYQVIFDSVVRIPHITMPDGKTLLIDYLKEAKSLLPNVSNWQVEIETANVKPQIDLLLFDKSWKPAAMDWKVSESWVSDYAKQLEIIGLVIYLKRLEKKDKDPYDYKDIKLYEVNLLKGLVKEHQLTEETAAILIDEVNLTSSDIKLIKENVKQNNLTIEDFDTTDNQSTCQLCNFAPLCSFLIQNKFQYDETTYLKFIQDKQFARN